MSNRKWRALAIGGGVLVAALLVLPKPEAPAETGEDSGRSQHKVESGPKIGSTTSTGGHRQAEADRRSEQRAFTRVTGARAGIEPSDSAALAEERPQRLDIRTTPSNTPITRVVCRSFAPGSSEATWFELAVEATGAQHRIEVGVGDWEFIGVAKSGACSALARATVTHEGDQEVCLGFEVVTLITGTAYDGVFGGRIEGATIALHALEGFESARPESDSAEASPLSARSDSTGRFELRTVAMERGQLAVSAPGYRTQVVGLSGAEGSGTIDVGNVAMAPIDVLEVRLAGTGSAAPTAYKIREGWDTEPVAFDANGVAFVELPKGEPDLALNLFAPDGVNLRIDLPGMALDHDPLTIDLDDAVAVEIEVEDWDHAFVARNLNLCVVSVDALGLQRFSVARVESRSVRAYAWGAGPAMASIIEISEETDALLAATSLPLARPGPSSASLRLGARAGWLVLDEDRVPQPDAIMYVGATRHASRFGMVFVADERGWVDAPVGLGDDLVANIHLPDGTVQTDLPLNAPAGTGDRVEVVVGRSERYEVRLEAQGAPLPWHRVSLQSAAPVELGMLMMSDGEGSVPGLDFRYGSRPQLVLHDPRLFERSRRYELRPGLNVIEVHQTAALELTLPAGGLLDALRFDRSDVERWIANGQVLREVHAGGGATRVLYRGLPLGDYGCTWNGEARGPFPLTRPNATHRFVL
ncbi:MAG: hypothetical protein R3F49_12170 [Planctomycetota bacterium]